MTRGPVTDVTLTARELAFIGQKVAADALTFMSHHARGALRPDEVERMRWLSALSDKLAALEEAARLTEVADLPPNWRLVRVYRLGGLWEYVVERRDFFRCAGQALTREKALEAAKSDAMAADVRQPIRLQPVPVDETLTTEEVELIRRVGLDGVDVRHLTDDQRGIAPRLINLGYLHTTWKCLEHSRLASTMVGRAAAASRTEARRPPDVIP